MQIPELRTERLLLRARLERDRAPYRAMNADPEVMRHFPKPLDAAESDAMFESLTPPWEKDGIGGWIVARAVDGAFLGVTGFSRPSFDPPLFAPEFEIGWRYARASWGHGYATEAARAALQFGFETVGLDEIVSFTVPANERSRHVMERLGMHRDAADDFDHPRLPEGHPLRRHVLYRLRASEWRSRADGGAQDL
ncbi:MAG TPA: GNAT family N-acetyltransferase [Candidatus Limnocylindrales bacterium]|nr:GNAT family N-acetyltransferase [Candidatus Limnocylindrales bacterium]